MEQCEQLELMNTIMEADSIEPFAELDLVEGLSDLIENGVTAIEDFFKSETMEMMLTTGVEICEETSKLFKIISIIKKTGSLSDKFFMKKIRSFCKGITEIPIAERKEFVERIGKDKLNAEANFILGIVQNTEEEEKFAFYSSIFRARVYEEIDDSMFRRLMILVARTLYYDLVFLLQNYTDGSVSLDCTADQGLVSAGWLQYEGMSIGTDTQPCVQLYKFTEVARVFSDIVNER